MGGLLERVGISSVVATWLDPRPQTMNFHLPFQHPTELAARVHNPRLAWHPDRRQVDHACSAASFLANSSSLCGVAAIGVVAIGVLSDSP